MVDFLIDFNRFLFLFMLSCAIGYYLARFYYLHRERKEINRIREIVEKEHEAYVYLNKMLARRLAEQKKVKPQAARDGKKRYHPRISAGLRNSIVQDYKDNPRPPTQIAKKYNLPPTTVYNIVYKYRESIGLPRTFSEPQEQGKKNDTQ